MTTRLVGILNVTPDSFSDGGLYFEPDSAIAQADRLFHDGAFVIDIGAESTRPHALALTPEAEWLRLEPVLGALLPKHPNSISVDSYHPETIVRAAAIGQIIINDVTGMNNPDMVRTAIALNQTIIVSHLPGADIQDAHRREPVSSIDQVKQDLLEKATILENGGLARKKIILDPGIGFGKTMDLNRQLLRFAAIITEYQVMIGYSRKRFLGEHRLELQPNIEAAKVAIAAGAAYLRVHDVAGHKRLLKGLVV
jgi:dihydropteroate synthase